MKTDLYTKFILTVIALALLAIALQGAIPPALAQNGNLTKVIICESQYICANVDGGGLRVHQR